MMWEYHLQTTTLCTRSMISFSCFMLVVNCGWLAFNTMIFFQNHFLELKFELSHTPIVKEN
jgi:hypothetical protein